MDVGAEYLSSRSSQASPEILSALSRDPLVRRPNGLKRQDGQNPHGRHHFDEKDCHGGSRVGVFGEPAGNAHVGCGSAAAYRLRMTTRLLCGNIGPEV